MYLTKVPLSFCFLLSLRLLLLDHVLKISLCRGPFEGLSECHEKKKLRRKGKRLQTITQRQLSERPITYPMFRRNFYSTQNANTSAIGDAEIISYQLRYAYTGRNNKYVSEGNYKAFMDFSYVWRDPSVKRRGIDAPRRMKEKRMNNSAVS